MKLTRLTSLLLTAFVALAAPQAHAIRTPLPDLTPAPLSAGSPLVETHVAAPDPIPADAWIIEAVYPIGQADDGDFIDMAVLVSPQTHTRVVYIVKSPLGLYDWSDFKCDYMTKDAWKYRGKVFAGVFVGAGKVLYGIGDAFYSFTGGAVYFYSGGRWQSYRQLSKRSSGMAGGMSTFVAHPIQTTSEGVANWQKSMADSMLEGEGLQVGEGVGSVTMQGLVVGETIVNPGAKLLSKAPGTVGAVGRVLTTPIKSAPGGMAAPTTMALVKYDPVQAAINSGQIPRYMFFLRGARVPPAAVVIRMARLSSSGKIKPSEFALRNTDVSGRPDHPLAPWDEASVMSDRGLSVTLETADPALSGIPHQASAATIGQLSGGRLQVVFDPVPGNPNHALIAPAKPLTQTAFKALVKDLFKQGAWATE